MKDAGNDPALALRRAMLRYRREKRRAAEIERNASEEFAQAIREAGAAGMKKSKILIAIENEWSRTWVDRAFRAEDEGREST